MVEYQAWTSGSICWEVNAQNLIPSCIGIEKLKLFGAVWIQVIICWICLNSGAVSAGTGMMGAGGKDYSN